MYYFIVPKVDEIGLVILRVKVEVKNLTKQKILADSHYIDSKAYYAIGVINIIIKQKGIVEEFFFPRFCAHFSIIYK